MERGGADEEIRPADPRRSSRPTRAASHSHGSRVGALAGVIGGSGERSASDPAPSLHGGEPRRALPSRYSRYSHDMTQRKKHGRICEYCDPVLLLLGWHDGLAV
jgi:hypothetical protein